MEPQTKTIIALSSGSVPSGVAVVRVSGFETERVLKAITGNIPEARKACLRNINHPETGELIDQGLVIFFKGPSSFSGEDSAEFQLHGGRAVVAAMLEALLTFENVRMAEAGEFSRRAFENGRLDLTEVEGLSDLIAAQTAAQRKLALSQSQGDLRVLYEEWRKRLIHLRAMVEAELDFSEEEDVPTDISAAGISRIEDVSREIREHLDDNSAGEIIRDGFKVALLGKPNAGKSSLLNALAKRDVAIVTEEAGTTRDVIDVHLDIGGYAVTVSDTAGIRQSDNKIEQEGIQRAQSRGKDADLVLWLRESGDNDAVDLSNYDNAVEVISKNDDQENLDTFSISSKTNYGLNKLITMISEHIERRVKGAESGLVSRARHRHALQECVEHLENARGNTFLDIELRAEALRLASDCLGKITGRIDVEDLLDVIFSEFCVGK